MLILFNNVMLVQIIIAVDQVVYEDTTVLCKSVSYPGRNFKEIEGENSLYSLFLKVLVDIISSILYDLGLYLSLVLLP